MESNKGAKAHQALKSLSVIKIRQAQSITPKAKFKWWTSIHLINTKNQWLIRSLISRTGTKLRVRYHNTHLPTFLEDRCRVMVNRTCFNNQVNIWKILIFWMHSTNLWRHHLRIRRETINTFLCQTNPKGWAAMTNSKWWLDKLHKDFNKWIKMNKVIQNTNRNTCNKYLNNLNNTIKNRLPNKIDRWKM